MGQEHRLRGTAWETAIAAAAKDGWRVVGAEACATKLADGDQAQSQWDTLRTSGGVYIATVNDTTLAHVDGESSWDLSPEGHAGRLAAAWGASMKGLAMFTV